MKKNLIALGAMLVAAFSLTNCAKEAPVTPEVEDNTFTLFANFDETKTVNNDLKTAWAEGDKVNVFHAAVGNTETFSSNREFTVSDVANGIFTGTVNTDDIAMENDWYVLYPYNEEITNPVTQSGNGYTVVGAKASGVQTQTGNNSKAHIAGPNYPMVGMDKNVPAQPDKPQVTMRHLTSLVEVVVKNSLTDPLTVTEVALVAGEDIVGTYFIDFTKDTPVFTASADRYVKSTAKLEVVEGTPIAAGASAKFYLAVKPFTAKNGTELKLIVNGVEKSKTLDNDVVFTAGNIKTLNFNCNVAPVEPDEVINIVDFCAANNITQEFVLKAGTPQPVSQNIAISYSKTEGAASDPTPTKIFFHSTTNVPTLRCYKNSTVNLASTKAIVKLEVDTNTSKGVTTDSGTFSVADGLMKWEGESNSINFIFTENHQISEIRIYYKK